VLEREIEEAAALCQGAAWATGDPLGIGSLLTSAYRLAVMILEHGVDSRELLGRIIAAAEVSLAAYACGAPLAEPASRRLAFRELGLAIGLRALEQITALTLDTRGSRSGWGALRATCPWPNGSTTSGAPRATVRALRGAPIATSTP
jgi:hypothetical protein